MKKAQKTLAGVLYFFMAIVIVALFMPVVREAFTGGLKNITSNVGNYVLITWIYTYWPVYFVIMILIILVIILTLKDYIICLCF